MSDSYGSDDQLARAAKLEQHLAKISKSDEIKAVILIYDDGACVFTKDVLQEIPSAQQFKYYWGFPPGKRPPW